MACRISNKVFDQMAAEEAGALGLKGWWPMAHDPLEPFSLAEVIVGSGGVTEACLNRKAIQSLVDEPAQARVIIRNLLRFVHCLPAPGERGCVLRWQPRDVNEPVQF